MPTATTADVPTDVLTIAEVARSERVSCAGVLRWALDGLLMSTGERIRLRTVRRGWRRLVLREDLDAWRRRIADDDAQRIAARDGARKRPTRPAPRQAETAALAAQAEARSRLAGRTR